MALTALKILRDVELGPIAPALLGPALLTVYGVLTSNGYATRIINAEVFFRETSTRPYFDTILIEDYEAYDSLTFAMENPRLGYDGLVTLCELIRALLSNEFSVHPNETSFEVRFHHRRVGNLPQHSSPDTLVVLADD